MMYRAARAMLFRLSPEAAHDATLGTLSCLERLHLARWISARPEGPSVRAMGIEFPNPVGLAAGLDKNADCLDGLAALGFGFIEVGTVTPKPQPGNPKPRLFRLARHRALVNRLGFNNKGVEHLVQRVAASRYRGVLGINIGKNKDTPMERAVDDYLTCLERVYPLASYVTVNLSSPNTPGLRELQHGDALTALLDALAERQELLETEHGRHVPLVVKIAPDLARPELEATAKIINQSTAEGVIATNTTIARPGLDDEPDAKESGGLSGAPLLGPANRTLRLIREALHDRITMIGVGGITCGADAAEKQSLGASLVQVYTGMIYRGPGLIGEVATQWRPG